MFNRKLQVDVVKGSKSHDVKPGQPAISMDEKAEIISDVIQKSVKTVGLAVCAYVLLDTVRKVAVASVVP